MLNIGGWELLIILLVALIFLGPDRLPEVARQVGQTVSTLRGLARSFQTEMEAAARPTLPTPASEPAPAVAPTADTAESEAHDADDEARVIPESPSPGASVPAPFAAVSATDDRSEGSPDGSAVDTATDSGDTAESEGVNGQTDVAALKDRASAMDVDRDSLKPTTAAMSNGRAEGQDGDADAVEAGSESGAETEDRT